MIFSSLHIHKAGFAMMAGLFALAGPAQAATVLTTNDGVIEDSLCVGFDCGGSPVFSDSTLLLKENNTRIKFADTSTGNFPANDWEIQANSNNNGGANYLGFNDCGSGDDNGGCANDLVFAVEAGARYAALYVESDGDVGLGTTNPAADLHILTGNSPTVRLQQDGTSGFAPQVWDVAGNETNFFIRDASNGSTLPLRIRPGASSNALFIDADNDIGMGAGANPGASLHIMRADGSARLRVEETNETAAPRFLAEFFNNGAAAVQLIDTSGAQAFWAFQSQAGVAAGDAIFKLTNSFGPGDEFVLQADGDLFITGTLTEGSDRNAKMAIVPVDPAEILAKVTALPVSAWTYKNDTSGARHLGPMAQDFHAIFGLGERDTGISTLDSSGVALAAIKALAEENAALRARLIAQSSELTARIEKLESAMQ